MRGMILAACLALAAVPARAQAPPPAVSLRAAGIFGIEHFTAAQTFRGIFGSANGLVYGGGVDVVTPHLFVRADVTHFGRTGERAFAFAGQVFRLGIPLDVSITPIVAAAGVRGRLSRTLIGYAGGGGGVWRYSESGEDPADAFSVSKPGFVALGGVEWRLHRMVAIGFEGQYARVPNAIGQSGLSADLGEKDLGGGTAAVRVIVGR
jgi:hypothetical protein